MLSDKHAMKMYITENNVIVKTYKSGTNWQDQTCRKRSFYTVCDGLSWFTTVKEWLKAHTINMITTGLYKICTQILIRSINSVSAASDKLGHSCKAGLLASGGFTLRRNTHSCCWERRKGSGTLRERWVYWTANRGSFGCKGRFLKFVFYFFPMKVLWLRIEGSKVSFYTSALWQL